MVAPSASLRPTSGTTNGPLSRMSRRSRPRRRPRVSKAWIPIAHSQSGSRQRSERSSASWWMHVNRERASLDMAPPQKATPC